MKKIVMLSGAGALLLAATGAFAKDGNRAEAIFQRLDTNGDGAISARESEAFRDERFAKMDADGDGTVTMAELTEAGRQRQAERSAKRFERMDTNGDGAIQKTEFEEVAAKRFERLDANGDGAVTLEEIRDRKGRRGG